MKRGIGKSVGLNGANEKDDVIFIQRALNAHANCHVKSLPTLVVDGRCGKNTRDAIEKFQEDYAGIKYPDSRVDPNGKTLRYLTMYLPEAFYAQSLKPEPKSPATQAAPSVTKTAAKPIATAATPVAGLDHITVSYANDLSHDRRVVSATAMKIIKMALKEAGLTHGVITSTFRTPRKQAEIMYDYASLNLAEQKELYGPVGNIVLKVFEKNHKTQNKEQVISLMENEILQLLKRGLRTSSHCVTEAAYKSLNVIDLGVKSTKSANRKSFDTERFSAALRDFEKQGLIKKFIDETGLKNSCWHLEILSSQPIPTAKDQSSLIKSEKLING